MKNYQYENLNRIFQSCLLLQMALHKLEDCQGNVIFVKDDTKKDGGGDMSVKGGWVKDPIVGMNTWTCCFDFASLYPTTLQELNISADSYKGYALS